MSQSCKLYSENKKLIIMFYAESFLFFYVDFILQVVLVVFIKKTEQIQIGFKIQMIVVVPFMI